MSASTVTFIPYLVGSGRSAQALLQSLKILEVRHPDWHIAAPIKIARGAVLPKIASGAERAVLLIANPHALHAPLILEAERAGFALVVCEKPAAVNSAQLAQLKSVKIPVAVLHVYRQTWGLQTLREMHRSGEFGEIVAVEGRYWQSSAAQRGGAKSDSWKNDPALGGLADATIDVGVHWIDAAAFVLGEPIQALRLWRSFANAESAHRDTHLHVQMEFPKGVRAMASISKTVHGAANHFEINVIGTKGYGCWKFHEPDQIELGHQAVRSFRHRASAEFGTGHPPFHGAGWMEGYVEILNQTFAHLAGTRTGTYPTLPEHLAMLEPVLRALEAPSV